MPRVMRGVGNRSMQSTALGFKVSAPIGISPTAMQRMAHPDGECATARGEANQSSCPTAHFDWMIIFVNDQPLLVTESSTLWVPSQQVPSKKSEQLRQMASTGFSCTSTRIGIFQSISQNMINQLFHSLLTFYWRYIYPKIYFWIIILVLVLCFYIGSDMEVIWELQRSFWQNPSFFRYS